MGKKGIYDHVGVRSKWLKVCKSAVTKCILNFSRVDPTERVSMWQIEGTSNVGEFWSSSIWKKVIGVSVQEEWKEGMKYKDT